MSIDPFSILFLVGVLQAIILVIALLRKKGKRSLSSRLLIAILSCIIVVSVQYTLGVNDIRAAIPYLWIISASCWFSIPPFLYLYARSLVERDFRLKPVYWLFFTIPIYNFLQEVIGLFGVHVGFHLLFDGWPAYTYWWLYMYLGTTTLFSVMAWLVLQKLPKEHPVARTVRWLKWYLMAFILAMVASALLLLFLITAEEYGITYEHGLVVLFEVFVLVLAFKSMSFSASLNAITKESYSNARRAGGELQAEARKLQEFMEKERPYLDKKLSLTNLAALTSIPQTRLSQLFSQELNTSFYDYVNQYRLEEAVRRMLGKEHEKYTITAIAEECGFNSKASFYRCFKQVHQMTPTQFIAEHRKAD